MVKIITEEEIEMRVIGMNTKYRVIELFLTGYTLEVKLPGRY